VPLAERLADPAARVLLLHGERALLGPDGGLALLAAPDAPAGMPLYLGHDGEHPYLAVVVDDEVVAGLDGEWESLRRIGDRLPDRDAGLFTEALALANWHAVHGFSPRSGAASEVTLGGWVRVDPTTGAELFPRTDPAIIVAVLDADDRLLLGSNASWEANRFSLLAGFVEPGESLEAAVIREVGEEAGLEVVDPEYLGSQPWPFPASLMLGFIAHVAPGADPAGRPDGEEILELRWFTREELAAARDEIGLPGRSSIARAIIEHWYGGPVGGADR